MSASATGLRPDEEDHLSSLVMNRHMYVFLITHLSGRIKGSGSCSSSSLFFFFAFVRGFNAEQTGMTWRVGALFFRKKHSPQPLGSARRCAQPSLLNILRESRRERSVFNYLRAVVSIQVESSALEEVKMTAASSEITAFQ